MNGPSRTIVLAVALHGLTLACTFSPGIPSDATLLCADPDPCPGGQVCRTDTGQCVALGLPCLVYRDDDKLASLAPNGSACEAGICVEGRCQPPACGDGVRSGAEECDDGNATDTEACRNDCVNARCGDGVVHEGQELCDDGNDSDEDACLRTCTPNICGDGALDPGAEECDDGNDSNEDGWHTSCITRHRGPSGVTLGWLVARAGGRGDQLERIRISNR